MRPHSTSALAVAFGALLLGPLSNLGASPEPGPPAPTSSDPTGPAPATESTAPADTPREGGTLRHQLADPASIDPAFVADEAGRTVVDAVFDSLTAVDADGQVVPAAALRWQVSPDASVFTFTLDPEATFHDGTPVVAGDFVRAFTRLVSGTAQHDPTSAHLLQPVAGFTEADDRRGPLAGVTAPGTHTLRIELREPRASFPAVLADPALAPIPAAAEEDPEAFALRPVGNGPFRLAEVWNHGESIALARFGDHPGPRPLLDEVVFELYSGARADEEAFADLEAGELDVASAPGNVPATSPSTVGATAEPAGYRFLDGGPPNTWFLAFATGRAPLDHPHVRQALSLLADRTAMVGLLEGAGTAATALVPPGLAGHRSGACDYCTYDPESARTLLQGLGVETLRIVVQDDLEHRAIADRFTRDVSREAGIDVQVEALSLPGFLDRLDGDAADVFLMAWHPEAPSPDEIVTPLFASSNIGTTNVTGYGSPYVDDLLARARRTPGDAQRLALFGRAEARALDDAALAPLLHRRDALAVADRVRGYEPGPSGRADLAQVWIAQL